MLYRTALSAALLLAPLSCKSAPPTPGAVRGPDSLPDGRYTLVVHGMSCPKCISNVEMQLVRVGGVVRPEIDMKNGFVHIAVEGGSTPRRDAISAAITDSGFTLVEIRPEAP
jgi:copper chaperone CopZ